jgi:hypothetical protein
MSAPQGKPLETKIADLVRRLGTDFDNEALAAARALKRLLADNGANFNDLGAAIEKFASGGLEETAMKRILEEGRTQGRAEAQRKHAEAEETFGKFPDGSWNWEGIALFCQRDASGRVRPGAEREFVNDMASRLSFSGREPTEKQAAWLLAIFRRLGGRLT